MAQFSATSQDWFFVIGSIVFDLPTFVLLCSHFGRAQWKTFTRNPSEVRVVSLPDGAFVPRKKLPQNQMSTDCTACGEDYGAHHAFLGKRYCEQWQPVGYLFVITTLACISFSLGKLLPASYFDLCGKDSKTCQKVIHNAVMTIASLPFDLLDICFLHKHLVDSIETQRISWYRVGTLVAKMLQISTSLAYLGVEVSAVRAEMPMDTLEQPSRGLVGSAFISEAFLLLLELFSIIYIYSMIYCSHATIQDQPQGSSPSASSRPIVGFTFGGGAGTLYLREHRQAPRTDARLDHRREWAAGCLEISGNGIACNMAEAFMTGDLATSAA
jgi:hypothetical protein